MPEDIDPELLSIRVKGALNQLLELCSKRGITRVEDARQILTGSLRCTEPVIVDAVVSEFEACSRKRVTIRPIEADESDTRPFGVLEGMRRDWYPGSRLDGLWGARRSDLEDRVAAGKMSLDDLRELDESSSCVVGLLASPAEPRAAVRGLVIGEVQSGKTGHMASVIAKAVDASFNVVIVLAGLTDVLRNQTQDRLDRDLFAFEPFDPRSHRRLRDCVQWSRKSTPQRPSEGEVAVTTQRIESDLRGSGWVLAVTKKNARTLERLCDALERADPQIRQTARVLVIDDEADSATPHAPSNPDLQPAGINRAVRRLLACFSHHSYIGYTATPYAVVFANPADPEGFYPRDFIVALPSSNAYFGMARIFGCEDDPERDGGTPWAIVPVPEESMERLKYRKDGGVLTMPGELREALQYFVCATAERWRRGQAGDSSTMLVHTTPFTAGHRMQLELVTEELQRLRSGVSRGRDAILAELRRVWERERARAMEVLSESADFDEIEPFLIGVLESLWACQENSVSKERIRFRDDRGEPVRQVAVIVGGNVLSRGVTLEGLLVSFFGRATDLYDALSQAGRWFGYRAGYHDLQRIWTTATMQGFYRDIATVDRDIRMQVRQLSATRISPLELPVSVRTHDLLRVTSPYKMWFAESVQVSVSGLCIETTVFDRGSIQGAGQRRVESPLVQAQWRATRDFFRRFAGSHPSRRGADGCSHVFDGIAFGDVVSFIRAFPLHPADPMLPLRDVLLKSYAYELERSPTFGRWNVAIIGVHRDDPDGGIELSPGLFIKRVNRARRSGLPIQTDHPDAAFIKQLSSPADVAVDLPAQRTSNVKARNALLELRRASEADSPPLIAFYAIDRASKPRQGPGDSGKQLYAELDAASDLIGYMLVHPILRTRVREHELREGRLAVESPVRRGAAESDEDLAAEWNAQEAGGQ